MKKSTIFFLLLLGCETEMEVEQMTDRILFTAPLPNWGEEDELGNANYLGTATTQRCALQMLHPNAKVYELGFPHSSTMPASPFASQPFQLTPHPSAGIPFTRHIGNEESISGILAHQGTQLDALGHFGSMDDLWFGEGPIPSATGVYYNGFTQEEIKPTDDSLMQHLGVENVPPIVTSAVIFDAMEWNGGEALEPGVAITKSDLVGMILSDPKLWLRGGILPGDAVYIRTGWGAMWEDPASNPAPYYLQGPGLAIDAAEYIAKRGAVLVGLDNPFTDAAQFCNGQICGVCDEGVCSPQPGTEPGLPFGIHHYNLSVAGVLQIQNMNLQQIADDNVLVACTMVLPLRMTGASGSPVRPVAIGR